jgi:HD superfamily phosphodiesterase
MCNYDEMFHFVEEKLKLAKSNASIEKTRIKYSRFQHIERVYAWVKRILSELSPQISVNEQELLVATIFHDVGQGLGVERSQHAELGAKICQSYLLDHGYDQEFIDKVCYLVLNHSDKELLKKSDTSLELIILMEADLLDDTASLGIVMDAMIEGSYEEPSFQKVYEHIEKYSMQDMKSSPMVTIPAKKFWREKQELTEEFIRQFKRDINL